MRLEYAGKSIRHMALASGHMHPYWELVYNSRGRGTTVIGDKSYSFDKGSIFLYPPQTIHNKVAQTSFEDYYLFLSDCPLRPKIYTFQDGQGAPAGQLVRIIYQCYHEKKQPGICTSLLDALMGLLSPEERGMDKNVLQLRHLLTAHFADAEYRVANAMACIPLNADYLRRCFKRETGMTPQLYLNRLRLENAKKLLIKTPQSSIAEVAYLSGFYDPLYFSRAFHKYAGMPPQMWRQQQLRR